MATQVFFRDTAAGEQQGIQMNDLRGTARWWFAYALSLSRGAAATSVATATVAGTTPGVEVSTGGSVPDSWLSPPVDAGFTLSGTITFNLRALESAAAANVAINCKIERIGPDGAVISTIVTTARTTELGTSQAAANFTATPTSTTMAKGDRLRMTVFGDDAGTMGSGRTFTFFWNGPTAAASGDSYVTFTENFGFQTTAPAGSVLYLTEVAGPAVGAAIELEAWTSRGSGVVSSLTRTAAGPTAPIQVTDAALGTAVEWYTRQLEAFTLAGIVRCNIRNRVDTATSGAAGRVEIAVVNNDGTGAVVWGSICFGSFTDMGATEQADVWDVSGADLSVTQGQRLRIRVYLDDEGDAALVNFVRNYQLYYAGTSGGASGDSFVTLGQTVTEFVAVTVPRNPAINHSNPAIL